MTHEALLDACREAPDDDAPRLVLADALGGERGELVVVQCALARGGVSPEQSGALRRRQRELVATHGVAWSGLAGLAKRVTFRRGFVDSVEIDARVLAARASSVFAAAPLLRHVFLNELVSTGRTRGPDPLPMLRRLFALPDMHRLAGVQLGQVGSLIEIRQDPIEYTFESLDAEAIAIAIESGILTQLRSFACRSNGTPDLREALPRIERIGGGLVVDSNPFLLAHAPQAWALSVESGGLPYPVAGVALRELRHGKVNDARLAALAASPIAAHLETLSLYDSQIHDAPSPLAALPRLRSLDIDQGVLVDPRGRGMSLAELHLPALRELHCSGLSVEVARAVAEAFGPQLELLDLSGCAADLHAHLDELRPLVAGDVHMAPWQDRRDLAFLGREPHEPLWDMPLVELPR